MDKKANKRFLVVTYWDFNEAHVQANVLPNLRILSREAGAEIYLFCLNKKPLNKEEESRVAVELAKDRIRLLWFHYSHFGMKMMLKFLWLIPYLCITVFRKKISRVYAWCTTAGAIGWLVSIFTGRDLILESYEPHAEAMVENGYWTRRRFPYKVLSWFEKKQAQRARFIIAANGGMGDYVVKRYKYRIPPEKFFAKPALVDLDQFSPSEEQRKKAREELGYRDDDIVCLYAGKFGGIYLEEETFQMLRAGYEHWKEKFRILLLTSQDTAYIAKHAEKAGLPLSLFITRFVPHQQVPYYMQAADFALCPVKPVPTKRYCTPVKNGEYWALGLPVLITADISDDSAIIAANRIGAVVSRFDENALGQAMNQLAELLRGDRAALALRIRQVAVRHRNYEISKAIYREIEQKYAVK